MPKICSYGGCTNNHIQKENISFFKFPDSVKEAERRAKWARACGRQNSDGSEWKPMAKYVYICSQHFINGKPSKDPEHPDFIPSIFTRTPRSSVKGQKRMDRFNSAKRRRLYSNDTPVLEPIDTIEDTGMLYATRLPATDEAGPPQIETALSHQANCIPPTPMSNKERSSLFTEIHNLREERDSLKDRLVQEQKHKLCTNVIEDDDEKSRFYTGLTWAVFLQTFIFINDGLRPANVGSMPNKEQFFSNLSEASTKS